MLTSLYMSSIVSFRLLSVLGDEVASGDPDTILQRFMSKANSRSVTVTVLYYFILRKCIYVGCKT